MFSREPNLAIWRSHAFGEHGTNFACYSNYCWFSACVCVMLHGSPRRTCGRCARQVDISDRRFCHTANHNGVLAFKIVEPWLITDQALHTC